jgi:hypothetical protein
MKVKIKDAIATEPMRVGSGTWPIIIVSTTPMRGVDTLATIIGVAILNRSL